MADGDAKALGGKCQPADARGGLELANLALAGAHESLLTGRPCHGAVGPERDMIDPALLRVGRHVRALYRGLRGAPQAKAAIDVLIDVGGEDIWSRAAGWERVRVQRENIS